MTQTRTAVAEGGVGHRDELPAIAATVERHLQNTERIAVADLAVGDRRPERIVASSAGSHHKLAKRRAAHR